MGNSWKDLIYNRLEQDYDLPKILDFINRYAGSNKSKIKVLDVGCGYGKKLKPLQDLGYNALGVDINPTIVETNQRKGLNCITLEALANSADQSTDQFDVVLLSHIIEHFQPNELLEFMDFYLDKLAPNGYLVIATPLLCNHFYVDFTHLKPYWPMSIDMIFGDHPTQVKYASKNKLKLLDLWFRRRPYYPLSFKQRYWPRGTNAHKLATLIDLISLALFTVSFRLLGVVDGWVGIYQKVRQKCPET